MTVLEVEVANISMMKKMLWPKILVVHANQIASDGNQYSEEAG